MEISISEASKQLRIGRSTIYKKIADGELSKTNSGKIDTAELFRVFGSSAKTPAKTPIDITQDTFKTPEDITEHPLYKAQAEKIRMLEESLRQAQEREQWHRVQIEKLTDSTKLLEAPKPKSWLSRLFQ